MSSFQPTSTIPDSVSDMLRRKRTPSMWRLIFLVAWLLFFGFLGIRSTLQVIRDSELESELRANGVTLQARAIRCWPDEMYHVAYSYGVSPTITKEEVVSANISDELCWGVFDESPRNQWVKIRVLASDFAISHIEGNTRWGTQRADVLVGWLLFLGALLVLFAELRRYLRESQSRSRETASSTAWIRSMMADGNGGGLSQSDVRSDVTRE